MKKSRIKNEKPSGILLAISYGPDYPPEKKPPEIEPQQDPPPPQRPEEFPPVKDPDIKSPPNEIPPVKEPPTQVPPEQLDGSGASVRTKITS